MTSSGEEQRLIADFFGAKPGYFVEVGANEPRLRSQTFQLEQAGWTGILVEPQADLAERLRAERTARVFACACSSPENAGRTLPLHVAGPLSSLDRSGMAPSAVPERVIEVPIRTLGSILEEAGAPAGFDFLSIDVRRYENNGWYVPVDADVPCFSRWEIVRKYYLALPVRRLRNLSRRMRGKITR